MRKQKKQVEHQNKKASIIFPVFILFALSVLFISGFMFGKPAIDLITLTIKGKEPVRRLNQYGLAVPARSPYEKEEWFKDPLNLLLVVDRNTALPTNYEPVDLVNLSAHGIKARSAELQGRIVVIYDLLSMFEDAKNDGNFLYVFSAYRSYTTQKQTYDYWLKKIGKEEADRSSARAGHSEHQLGTTFDMSATNYQGDVFDGFGEAAAGIWLSQNSYKYGFVMSYPPNTEAITGYIYEPWHFRYVGRECAKIIHELGVIPSVFIRELDAYRKSIKEQNSSDSSIKDPELKVLG